MVKLIAEFSKVEPRLKNKMKGKFQELLKSQKAKSMQLEVLRAVIGIYKNEPVDEVDIYGQALKVLIMDFVDHRDPNLRYLGIKLLSEAIDEKTKSIFSPKLF